MTSILLYKQATHPWRDGWFPGLGQGKGKTRLEHPTPGHTWGVLPGLRAARR